MAERATHKIHWGETVFHCFPLIFCIFSLSFGLLHLRKIVLHYSQNPKLNNASGIFRRLGRGQYKQAINSGGHMQTLSVLKWQLSQEAGLSSASCQRRHFLSNGKCNLVSGGGNCKHIAKRRKNEEPLLVLWQLGKLSYTPKNIEKHLLEPIIIYRK